MAGSGSWSSRGPHLFEPSLQALRLRLIAAQCEGTLQILDGRVGPAARIDEATALTASERRECKDSLRALTDGVFLLHGDFHPGNIHLSAAGPVVIDWLDAVRGAAADVARTLILGTPATIPLDTADRARFVGMSERFGSRYEKEIHLYPGGSAREIQQWTLPVAAARLSEGIVDEEPSLLALVRAVLR